MTTESDRSLPEVLTLQETADRLRISITTAKKLAANGTLPGLLPKLGRQWRVSRKLLEEHLETPVAVGRTR